MEGGLIGPELVEIDIDSMTFSYEGRRVRITGLEAIILRDLLADGGASYESMLNSICAGRKEGGSTYKSLGVRLRLLRLKLVPIGLSIDRVNQHRCEAKKAGSRKGRYKLRVQCAAT